MCTPAEEETAQLHQQPQGVCMLCLPGTEALRTRRRPDAASGDCRAVVLSYLHCRFSMLCTVHDPGLVLVYIAQEDQGTRHHGYHHNHLHQIETTICHLFSNTMLSSLVYYVCIHQVLQFTVVHMLIAETQAAVPMQAVTLGITTNLGARMRVSVCLTVHLSI